MTATRPPLEDEDREVTITRTPRHDEERQPPDGRAPTLSRRQFLPRAAAAVGIVAAGVVGYEWPHRSSKGSEHCAAPAAPETAAASSAPSASC